MNTKRDIAFYHMLERRGWRPRHPAVGDGLPVPFISPLSNITDRGFFMFYKKILKKLRKKLFLDVE